MNLAEAANLVLTLQLKDQVSSGLQAIDRRMGGLNTKAATLTGGLGKVGAGIGVGLRSSAVIGGLGIFALWKQVDHGIESLAELEDVQNQTKAVIESTGGVAGVTADEVRRLAEEFEELTGVDDKVIQGAENVLLTFRNIKTDAFEPATQAILDMSAAMEVDLEAAALTVGKALNDPIGGMTALKRVGVQFTEEQEAVIRTMVETGDTAGAQQVILQELNEEFGGSAAASMEGYRGTQIRLKDTVEELQMALAEALLPALENVSTELRKFLKDPAVKEGIKNLGKSIAELFSPENVKGGGEAMKGLFTFLRDLPWNQIKDGLSFAAENAKKVVDVFRSLPPGVQAGLLTFLAANKLTGGLVASGLGELLKVGLSSLRTITAGSVTVIGPVTGGAPGVPGVPGAPKSPVGNLLGALGPITIGAVTAVAFDQFALAGAQSIRDVGPLDTDAAAVLTSTPFVGAMANAVGLGNNPITNAIDQGLGPAGSMASVLSTLNDPVMGFFTGMLGPGVREVANELGVIGDQAVRTTENTASISGAAIGIINAVGNAAITANRNATSTAGSLQGVITKSQQQIGELGIIRNNTLITSQRSAAQLGELAIIKNHTQLSNQKSAAQLGELATIRNATQTTARKDLSVNVTLRSTFQVSAREIANQIQHWENVRGPREFG